MKLLKLFKKKTDKKKEIIKDSDELYTKVLYNEKDSFIVLISYSEDYAVDMVEFLDACKHSFVEFTTMISVFEEQPEDVTEEDDDEDFAIKPATILRQKQYVLLGAHPRQYARLYSNINNLSNSILAALEDDFYNYITSSIFNDHINNGVMELERFRYKRIAPNYDKTIDYVNYGMAFDNVPDVLSKLPNGFFPVDLLNIFTVREGTFSFTTMYKILISEPDDYHRKEIIDRYDVYQYILKDPELIFMDKYKLEDPSDITVGDSTDVEIDDMFKEEYDKFSAMSDPTIYYETSDEILEGGENDDTGKSV